MVAERPKTTLIIVWAELDEAEGDMLRGRLVQWEGVESGDWKMYQGMKRGHWHRGRHFCSEGEPFLIKKLFAHRETDKLVGRPGRILGGRRCVDI